MGYLILGFIVVWICLFGYLFYLDRQAREIARRLDNMGA